MATSSGYMRRLRAGGIKSVDACKEYNFSITKNDIKRSRPGCSKECVIANKLKKELGVREVHVFSRVAHVLRYDEKSKTTRNFRHSIDPKTQDAIRQFDEGKSFPTGNYVLRTLTRSETKKEKKKRDKKRKTHPSGKGRGLRAPKVRLHVRKYEDNWI